MFGIGYVEVLAALGLALLLVLLRRTWSTARWTRVDDEHAVTVTAEALEAPFTRLLSDLPGTRLRAGGQATWTLVVTRASWWTILPAVALFPLGVLFLLFREEADLVVTLRPTADGSVLRVIGTTRVSVADALRTAVAELPSAPRPRETGVPVG